MVYGSKEPAGSGKPNLRFTRLLQKYGGATDILIQERVQFHGFE
jgi:hypothetical protein